MLGFQRRFDVQFGDLPVDTKYNVIISFPMNTPTHFCQNVISECTSDFTLYGCNEVTRTHCKDILLI